jgi:hypothetical protein
MDQAHTTHAKAHHSSGQHTPSLVLISVSLELDAPGQSNATRTRTLGARREISGWAGQQRATASPASGEGQGEDISNSQVRIPS